MTRPRNRVKVKDANNYFNTNPRLYDQHVLQLQIDQRSLATRMANLQRTPNGGSEAADFVRSAADEAGSLNGLSIRGLASKPPGGESGSEPGAEPGGGGGGFDEPGGDIGPGAPGLEGGGGGDIDYVRMWCEPYV